MATAPIAGLRDGDGTGGVPDSGCGELRVQMVVTRMRHSGGWSMGGDDDTDGG